jgi:serine O-acetyltransferase
MRAPSPEQVSDDRADEETYRSPGLAPLRGRGGWWGEFREDLARYAAHHDERWLFSLCLEQGLWALLQYRVASSVYRSNRSRLLKGPFLRVLVAWQKMVEIVTGVSLPHRADLAPGLYIGHFGPTLIHPDARIATGCNISQGVSIGLSGRGARRGAPTIGERVYVGANAVVAGRIHVGDGAVIGANALVTRDVPPGCTVVGNPAQVVSSRSSTGMGLHHRPVPAPAKASADASVTREDRPAQSRFSGWAHQACRMVRR